MYVCREMQFALQNMHTCEQNRNRWSVRTADIAFPVRRHDIEMKCRISARFGFSCIRVHILSL
jgi:hypothetical protein